MSPERPTFLRANFVVKLDNIVWDKEAKTAG